MDHDAISDLFAGLGPVSIRRMFGGKGIYFDGVIIAVELRGELMLKGDAIVAPDYEAAGASNGPTSTRATASRSPCPTGRCPTALPTAPTR